MEILALSSGTARHIGEVGFLIGALGALLLLAEAVRPDPQSWSRQARLLGFLMMAVAFVLGIVYVHGV